MLSRISAWNKPPKRTVPVGLEEIGRLKFEDLGKVGVLLTMYGFFGIHWYPSTFWLDLFHKDSLNTSQPVEHLRRFP